MSRQLFTTPTGMHDILPEDNPYWEKVRQEVFEMAKFYGFGYIETPILEHRGVFEKSLGAVSDVVEKEMFSLETKGGDDLILRTENTPQIMRAYLEHGWESIPQPVKLFYLGQMFRYESPQAGRFRQFHQFGFEIIGSEDPINDAELILIAMNLLKDIGVKNLICEVNSLGDKACRTKYKQALKDYFRPHIKKMCGNCARRFKVNPLRILDCKEEKCREIILKAPQILDFICDDCRNHFKKLLEFLDELEVPYLLNPYLVRGLDYYTKTVFEIYNEAKRSSQSALAGGGRYDGLGEILGGKNIPAVGFAAGIERIIYEMKESKSRVPQKPQPKIFLVQLGDLGKKKSLKLMEEFRKNNILVSESLSKHSIKSQMKSADKEGVRLTLILGQKEALDNEIIIRDMISGVQETVPIPKLINEIRKRLKTS
jgi:histidyl-tRNA synthetase